MQTEKKGHRDRHVKIYLFLAMVTLIVISVITVLGTRQGQRSPINVVFLTIDTIRPDHLGFSGYHRNTTPFLDTLAKKGVAFHTVISSAPWTSPGLLSVFTGLYPMVHGVTARGRTVLSSIPTLFDVFREGGYRVPNIAYLTQISNFMNLGLEQKRTSYKETARLPGDELIHWIRDHRDRPFLAWYHYRFLHLPYDPPAQYNVYIDAKRREMLETPFFKEWVKDEVVIPWGRLTFTPAQQKTIRDLYDGQLHELDAFISRLYDDLKQLNRWEDTLLILTADHGEELFEHGFVGHASTAKLAKMYDEVLKIPFVLYGPRIVPEGVKIEKQVRQIDIMPTVLEIAGLPIPSGVQGKSLLSLIKGKKPNAVPVALSESIMGGYQSDPFKEKRYFYSIREEKWKLVRIPHEGGFVYKLFDLVADPGETQNVGANHSQVVARLKARLETDLEKMQVQRLILAVQESAHFKKADIPSGAALEKPVINFPRNGQRIKVTGGDQIELRWSGNPSYSYVIEYDAGKGWRKLTGRLPVQGTSKIFGALPAEAYEPLPYWNPYRIRVAPFGQEKYWSEWVEFHITYEKGSP